MRIILFIFLVSFASCQKCQTCEQDISVSYIGSNTQPQKAKLTFEACGSDLRAIKNKTTVATSTSNGVTARVTTKTVCY